MAWVLVALAGCAVEQEGSPYSGGGVRVTSHQDNTGGGDDTGDTGEANAAAPVISDLALFFADNGGTYIIRGEIVYTDAQDDVAGGKLFFDVTAGTGSATTFNLAVVEKADIDPGKQQAYIDTDGTLIFAISPVDIEKDYLIEGVVLKDASGNSSEAWSGDVLGGSYTP